MLIKPLSLTIGSSIGNLGNQSSGLNGMPASSNLGMPYDSQSSSVSSVSIPVTPSDVRASVNVAPTSTKQKKKWVHFIVMLSAHFYWGGSTCNLHLKGVRDASPKVRLKFLNENNLGLAQDLFNSRFFLVSSSAYFYITCFFLGCANALLNAICYFFSPRSLYVKVQDSGHGITNMTNQPYLAPKIPIDYRLW